MFWGGGGVGIEIGASEMDAWMVEEGWGVPDGRSCGMGWQKRVVLGKVMERCWRHTRRMDTAGSDT